MARQSAVWFAIAMTLTVLTCGCRKPSTITPTGSNTSIINVTWDSVPGIGADTEVFVNGTKVGQVGRQASRAFNFIPSSGDNVLELRYNDLAAKCYWKGSFAAKPGYVFSISFQNMSDGTFLIISRSDSAAIPTEPAILNVHFEDTLAEMVTSEEIMVSRKGADLPKSKSYTISQAVDISEAKSRLTTAGVNYEILQASVTRQIENKRGISLSTSKTVTPGVVIRGDSGGTKYRVIWYNQIRKGTVEFQTQNGPMFVPFSYVEDARADAIPQE